MTKKTTKTTKTTKTAKDACPKEAKKVDLGKVTEAVKKAPQWLVRAEAELKKLIIRLQKLDEMLEKILGSLGGVSWASVRKVRGTKSEIRAVQLLMKQRDAMAAYKAALEERIALAKA